MTFKDEMRATGGKAAPASGEAAAGDAASGDADDIAKLLRALNEDIDRNDRHPTDGDDDDGFDEADSRSWFPFGKIAMALVAAGAIGFGIVLLDSEGSSEPETVTASVTPATVTPTGGTVAPVVGGTPAQQAQTSPSPSQPPAPAPQPAPAPPPVPARSASALPPPGPLPQGGASQTQTRPITELMLRAPEPPPSDVAAPTATLPSLRVPEPPAPLAGTPAATAPAEPPATATITTPVIPTQTVTTPVVTPPVPAAPLAPPAPAQLQAMLSPSADGDETTGLDETDAGLTADAEDTVTEAAPSAPVEEPARAPARVAPSAPRTAMVAPAAPARPDRPAAAPRAEAPRTAAPSSTQRPPAAAAADGGRYVVQVGTFKVAENAAGLAAKLKAGGYPAFTVQWNDSAGTSWHAVRVGGYGSEALAKRTAEQVRSRFGQPSVVIRR